LLRVRDEAEELAEAVAPVAEAVSVVVHRQGSGLIGD